MQVILLERINKLGSIGDNVDVKSGYARNYLLPQGKAIQATEANKQVFEEKKAILEQEAEKVVAQAKDRSSKLENLILTIESNVSDEGKLYGSVGVAEIVEAITKLGKEVDKSEVVLPEGPLDEVGEYQVRLKLHADVEVEVKVLVAPKPNA